VLLAFAGVYLIWGSTYLAVRFAVETIPPFLMAGTRFTVAGAILYRLARMGGAAPPERAHWRTAATVGALLIVGSMGFGAWSLKFVASGLGAVLIATVPMWTAVLAWLWFKEGRPTGRVTLGLILGMIGILLIVGPDQLAGSGQSGLMAFLGMLVLIGGAALWAYGSLYSRDALVPPSQQLFLGMQMLAGGGMLLVIAALIGDVGRLDLEAVALRSIVSLADLIVFGAILAFTAYFYLLRVTTPARATTYAYINPVIALFLGWALGDEPLTARTLIACAVVIAGVVIITTERVAPTAN
jgi:drug/metabolite transporter (DMT)-like permease